MPLNGVAVNDSKLSATPIVCTPASVPVGGTATCGPVTYTITPADETAGSVDNSATATGTPPGGSASPARRRRTSTPVTAAAPALTLVKTAGTPVDVNGNGITDAGDTIAYSFAITNTGNVPLNGVVVNDTKVSATPITCTPANVPVGGTANCGPVTYTITAADETAGSVDNSATATGTPPGGTAVTSDPSTTSTPVVDCGSDADSGQDRGYAGRRQRQWHHRCRRHDRVLVRHHQQRQRAVERCRGERQQALGDADCLHASDHRACGHGQLRPGDVHDHHG